MQTSRFKGSCLSGQADGQSLRRQADSQIPHSSLSIHWQLWQSLHSSSQTGSSSGIGFSPFFCTRQTDVSQPHSPVISFSGRSHLPVHSASTGGVHLLSHVMMSWPHSPGSTICFSHVSSQVTGG